MTDALTTLAHRLSHERQITVRGLDQIRDLRQTLAELYTAGGLRIEFDPTSSPEWVDYLMVALPSITDGALKGAAVGIILGALANSPSEGAALGGLIGAALGAQSGVRSVERGWRIRVGVEGGGPTAHLERITPSGAR